VIGQASVDGDINKQTGAVKFSERSDRVRGIQGARRNMFHDDFLFAERAMDAFDRVIPNVAEMDPGVGSWVSENGQV
jgi:hypothetical protein